jgi:hypothetical protein
VSIWNEDVRVREVFDDSELGSLVGKCCPKCHELTSRSDPTAFCYRCCVDLEWCDADGRYVVVDTGASVAAYEWLRSG